MKPLLSVVVPLKGNPSGYRTTLDSMRTGLEEGWLELIVQDATAGALTEFGGGVSRFAESDAGIYDAMNRGLQRARGSWVLFAGAGDRLCDGDAVRAALERARLPLQVFRTALDEPREPGVPAAYAARWDRSLLFRHTVHHQGVCYRVDALPPAPFDARWKVLADYALHLQLWRAGWEAECHAVQAMRVAAGGVSRDFHPGLYWEEWRMKRAVLGRADAAIQLPWLLAKWGFKQLAGLTRP